MTTRTYTNRSNAVRAAKAALGATAISDVHFKITQNGDEYAWVEMDLETGRPVDGAEQAALEATHQRAAKAAGPGPDAEHVRVSGGTTHEATATMPAMAERPPVARISVEQAFGDNPLGFKPAPVDALSVLDVPTRTDTAEPLVLDPNDPLVVGGRRYGNATRAAEARKALEAKAARAERSAAPKEKPVSQRAQREADAAQGIVPQAPDFSAETHKAYRKRLADVVALVEAGDAAALKAHVIPTPGSSGKALARYRDLAVIALEAQAAKG